MEINKHVPKTKKSNIVIVTGAFQKLGLYSTLYTSDTR